ncbi:integral membrane protein [Fusarium bulbicola]|nr:integral membrane protein [Fusarium bulbicola]
MIKFPQVDARISPSGCYDANSMGANEDPVTPIYNVSTQQFASPESGFYSIVNMILIAWILTSASGIIIFVCIPKGDLDDAVGDSRYIAAILLITLGIVFSKLTLCAIYYGVVRRLGWSSYTRYAILGSVVLVIVPFILHFALLIAGSQWDEVKTPCHLHRPTIYRVYIEEAGIWAVVDLTVVIAMLAIFLPDLHGVKTIVTTVGFVSNGLLTLAVILIRLMFLVIGLKNLDTTFVLAKVMLCLFVESNIVIIFGSLTELRTFTNYFGISIFESPQPLTDSSGSQGIRVGTGDTVGGTPMNGVEPGSGRSEIGSNSDLPLL